MALILPFRGMWPKIHPDAFIADNATIIGDGGQPAKLGIKFRLPF